MNWADSVTVPVARRALAGHASPWEAELLSFRHEGSGQGDAGQFMLGLRYGWTVPRANFGTAISCIDGRVHLPVINWMQDLLSVDFVDLVTYPGADGLLAHDPLQAAAVLRPAVEISVQRHASPVLAIVGHHDCAANPGTPESHREQLLRGLRVLQEWRLGVKLTALWVNAEWQVEVLRTRGAEVYWRSH